MDKLSADVISQQLAELGHDSHAIQTIQNILGIKNMSDLTSALEDESIAYLNRFSSVIKDAGLLGLDDKLKGFKGVVNESKV